VDGWVWVSRAALELLHEESLAEHGGASGIRDPGLLESALMRPHHALAYGNPDTFDLAASYAVGLARNHPFVDGNKRAAFLAAGLFLLLNGHRLVVTQAQATQVIFALAAGEIDEADFSAWLRGNVVPRSK
jgi:death-on-curing protein